MKSWVFSITLILSVIATGCLTGEGPIARWFQPALEEVKEKTSPLAPDKHVKEKAVHYLSIGMGAGLSIAGVGVCLFFMWSPKPGIGLGVSGVVIFLGCYLLASYALFIAIAGGVTALGFGVWVVVGHRGMLKGLLNSFEVQKDQKWDLGVEQQVKKKQGRHQLKISTLRKRLLMK